MASSHQPKGRGRSRTFGQQNPAALDLVPAPAITTTTDIQQTPPPPVSGRGRGRGKPKKADEEVGSAARPCTPPAKPSAIETLGEPITVRTNFFPIIRFPQRGIVHQYDIEIRNKKGQIIPTHHRRAIYNTWLKIFRENYPNIDPYRIVFDSQRIIFTFDQILPDVDENGMRGKIRGPNRENIMGEYDVFVRKVGNPIDLACLRALKDFSQAQSDDNININELESIKQMLSIALHEHCSSNADFIVNRSFFSRQLATNRFGSWDLGLGKAIWRGFYSCLVFGKGEYQLLMNLDVNYGVFMTEQPFLDFLCQIMRQSPTGKWLYSERRKMGDLKPEDVLNFFDPDKNGNYYQDEMNFLLDHCRNRSVCSEVAKATRGYRIASLGQTAIAEKFFWKDKNIEVTVKDYYKEHYGIDLKYPTLPTLKMSNGACVPMEFIRTQAARVTKITDEQRAALCTISSLPPANYSKSVQEVRTDPNQQLFEDDPFVAAWNFDVRTEMLTIPARVLPPPTIVCNDNNKVTQNKGSKKGVWNHSKTEFYKPTKFPPIWALINLSQSMDLDACERFYRELKHVANDRGIGCPAPQIVQQYDAGRLLMHELTDQLRTLMIDNRDCQFYFIILPEDDRIRDPIYAAIKEMCELESDLGILTQMLKLKRNEGQTPWNYSRLNNLLMKINTKLDGINSIIHVSNEDATNFFSRGHRIMYVGIDLSHGSPHSEVLRSTVAVVASVGDIPIRYLKEIYIQDRSLKKRGQSWESIIDMKEIMKSLIIQYAEHGGDPPSAIIIYRDGISTSEFNSVFHDELTAVREACVEFGTCYQPYLTYIVVNKRHHTRFFSTESDANVEAGTVVDSSDITNSTTCDFYLNSHHVDKAKGTSRPGHYHVLYDDNHLTRDQVQMLSYGLCYLHARCSSSISIPAPVKYADLLAFRATKYKHVMSEPLTPIDQQGNAETIKSKRIVLSPNLKKDCPFFL